MASQLADAAFAVSGAAPLPPQAQLARAALDPQNQQAARKGLNYAMAGIFGVAALIAYIISIALLVVAGKSDVPHVQDGRWYGGWSVLVLAALPLTWLAGYTLYKNSSCEGDVVGALANLSTGRLGRAAQAYQAFRQ